MIITMSTRSDSLLTEFSPVTSFHTADIRSMVSHLKPFNVASIQIANVSNMIRKISTRSGSLLTIFSPVTSFHTGRTASMVSHFVLNEVT